MSVRAAAVALLSTLGLTAGLVATAPAAQAVTCPRVDSVTHLVTPAPIWFADWSGCDLTGANLRGAILPGVNLSRANLTGADFGSSNVYGSNFDGAVMTNVRASGTWLFNTFRRANLDGATMTLEYKSGLDLSTASLNGFAGRITTIFDVRLPSGWVHRGVYVIGPGANLTGADLRAVPLTGPLYTRTNLTRAIVTGRDLRGIDLSTATLTGIVSGSLTGAPSALPPDWVVKAGYLIGPGANLTGADLTLTDLRGRNLARAVLTGARLGGVALSGANLAGVISGGITTTPSSLPTSWRLFSGYLMGPGANLSNANLAGANLTGFNLSRTKWAGATLTGATVRSTSFYKANLSGVRSGGLVGTPSALPSGWALRYGYLIGAGADLRGASLAGRNLSGLSFTRAKLDNAVITGSSLSGTKLASASVYRLITGRLTGTPASLPTGTRVVSGYLVGNGTSLRAVDLRGRDLSGLHLTGSDITGTRLSGAILTGVQSGDLAGIPASLPTSWKLIRGYLIGPGTDLTEAYLRNQKLMNVNLTGALLSRANLSGADLTGANLTGATGTGIIWTGAICADGATAARHVNGSCLEPLSP